MRVKAKELTPEQQAEFLEAYLARTSPIIREAIRKSGCGKAWEEHPNLILIGDSVADMAQRYWVWKREYDLVASM